ncbi:MAG: hypothetical protein COA79_23560 [Planctomycetota bacterium]|nr:MAG: hypothetical protein COA79_23560 [Planctomycetota bacterium]
MRFLITIIFVLTFLGTFANPKIKLPVKTKNFGTILPNSTHKHTFIIKNEGKTNLIISKVKPGCGCTVANISSKNIKPGEFAKLDIDYKAPEKNSVIRKQIHLHSNDKTNPKATLWIEANIKGNYKASSQIIQLNSVLIGEKKTFSFTITPSRKLPFYPHRLVYSKTTLNLKYTKVDEKNTLSSYKFDVTYDSTIKLPPRRINEKIFIYPNKDNNKEVITINIHGTVNGLINQSIKSFVTSLKQGDKIEKKARLKHLKKESFIISKVMSNNPMVTTEIIKISGHEYDILINMKEGSKKRRENVIILIHTDNPQQKVIRIMGTYLFKPT